MLNYGMGQDNIIKHFDTFSLDKLPRTNLICGLEGSGKHSLVEFVVNKFNLLFEDITNLLSFENIQEIYNRPEPYIYLIDVNKLNERSQNIILKLIEEPLKNAYLFLIANSDRQLLPTIKNRCVTYYMEIYSKDYLSLLCDDKDVLELAQTPGDIQIIVNHKSFLEDTFVICKKLFTKINIASYPNTLSIVGKIDFKNTGKGIPIKVFNMILSQVAKRLYFEHNPQMKFNYYIYTANYLYNCSITSFNAETLFQNYLTKMWRASR